MGLRILLFTDLIHEMKFIFLGFFIKLTSSCFYYSMHISKFEIIKLPLYQNGLFSYGLLNIFNLSTDFLSIFKKKNFSRSWFLYNCIPINKR